VPVEIMEDEGTDIAVEASDWCGSGPRTSNDPD
jgi:hypothetical protein